MHLHDEDPILPPAPEDDALVANENGAPKNNGIPVDLVDQFRFLNQEMELELFARIRVLENRMIEGLPPQLNLGEYETLVRGFLDNTLTINHYCNNENSQLDISELKAN